MSTGQNRMRNDENDILAYYRNPLNFRPLFRKPKLKEGLNPVVVKAGAIALVKKENINKVFKRYGVVESKVEDYVNASQEYYEALYA